jgi:hypothetical protein
MASDPRLVTRRTIAGWLAAALAAAAAIVLAASDPGPRALAPPPPPVVADLPDAPGTVALPPRDERPAAPPVALTPADGGRALVWAERGTGRVLRATLEGTRVVAPVLVADLPVVPGAGAGVRGIAVDRRGRVLVSFVRRRGRRLVVVALRDGLRPRTAWVGPRAGRLRVGGGLAALPGGRVVVGIGDQGRLGSAAQPGSLLGRVVTIDPGGRAGQEPRRRSRGWHDPLAIAADPRGRIWVADRLGGGDAERTGRADRPRLPTVRSPFRRAPIALAITPDSRLLLACGLGSGRLDRTVRRGVGAGGVPQVLDVRCRYGATVVGDEVLVVDDAGAIVPSGTVAELAEADPVDG